MATFAGVLEKLPDVAARKSTFKRDAKKKYVLHGPEKNKTLDNKLVGTVGKILFDQMKKHGERIAQVNADDDTKETFASLRLRSILVAQELRSRGICSGHMVTVGARNSADTFAAVLGALFVPVAVSNISVELGLDDIKDLLTIAKPNIIFCDFDVARKVEQAASEIHLETPLITFGNGRTPKLSFSAFQVKRGTENVFQPAEVQDLESTAFVVFSSGSTGSPKGIDCSYKTATKIIEILNLHLGPSSIIFVSSPLYWYSGWLILLQATYNGCTRVLSAESFSEERTLALIEKYKVNMILQATSNIHRITKHPSVDNYDLSSLKLVLVGGAKLSFKLAHSLRAKIPNGVLVTCYGSSETGIITYNVVGRGKEESVGKLRSGCSAKIMDVTSGKTLGANNVGEIYAKSGCMASGYYNNKEQSINAFDEDGWFRTGDLGYYDDDEFIFMTDRIKEALKYRGFQVEPAAVETIVLLHSDVVECGIVGVPHLTDGDHLVAFVQKVPSSKVTEQDIKDFVAGRVSEMKHLHGGVIFMESIPMLPSGKINKKLLKQLALDLSHRNSNM